MNGKVARTRDILCDSHVWFEGCCDTKTDFESREYYTGYSIGALSVMKVGTIEMTTSTCWHVGNAYHRELGFIESRYSDKKHHKWAHKQLQARPQTQIGKTSSNMRSGKY